MLPAKCSDLQELAWASYALLRNTNSRGMIVVAGKKLWLARGAVDSEALQGNGSASLVGSSKVSRFFFDLLS